MTEDANRRPIQTADVLTKLREETDAPLMECLKALTEAQGVYEDALAIIRSPGPRPRI